MVAAKARPARLEIMLDPQGGWNIEMNDVYVYMALDSMMRTLDVDAPSYFPIRMVLSKEAGSAWLAYDEGVVVIEQVADYLARGVLPGNVLLFSRHDGGHYTNVTAREICQILAYDGGVTQPYYSRQHPNLLFFRHARSRSTPDPKAFIQIPVSPNRKALVLPQAWVRRVKQGDAVDHDCNIEAEAKDAYTRIGSLPSFEASSCTLENVLLDMAWYAKPEPNKEKKATAHHVGTLEQHSRWTAQVIKTWFRENDPRALGLGLGIGGLQNVHDLAVVSALLHDVGKAGDADRSDMYKPLHPSTAMEYATGKAKFIRVVPQKAVLTSFRAYLSERCVGMTPSVLAVAAVVAACHYNLGNVIRGRMTSCGWVRAFLAECSKVVEGANEAIVMQLAKPAMIILAKIVLCVSMADVVGSRPLEQGDEDPQCPWQRYGYPKKWATACVRILRALAVAIGLPRDSELITGVHITCRDHKAHAPQL